jgi:hypothetical protein
VLLLLNFFVLCTFRCSCSGRKEYVLVHITGSAMFSVNILRTWQTCILNSILVMGRKMWKYARKFWTYLTSHVSLQDGRAVDEQPNYLIFEVLAVVSMKITIFMDVTPSYPL